MKEIKNNHLKILLSVLFFGGLWGILEAVLGTILHIHAIADSMGLFGSSTAVILPLAFLIMGLCYKKTGTVRSIVYIGLITAGIKAITCAIFSLSFNPCYYIMLESACFALPALLIKPKEIASIKYFGNVAIASTLFLFISTTFIRDTAIGSSKWIDYVVYSNLVVLLYSLIVVGFAYLIKFLFNRFNVKPNINKAILNPIVCSSVAVLALVLTVLLK